MITVFYIGAGLCNLRQEGYYSSANFNLTAIDEFGIITHS